MAGNRVPREAVAEAGGWARPVKAGAAARGLFSSSSWRVQGALPRPAQRRTSPGAEAAAATRLALVAWSPGEGTDPRAGGNRGCLSSGVLLTTRSTFDFGDRRAIAPPPTASAHHPPPPRLRTTFPGVCELLRASQPSGPRRAAARAGKAASRSERRTAVVQNNGLGVPNGRRTGIARRAAVAQGRGVRGAGSSLDDVPGPLAAPATFRAAQPGPPAGRDAGGSEGGGAATVFWLPLGPGTP